MGENKENSVARIKELVDILNRASKAYYSGADEIMTNFEYDKLYDELVELEKSTNLIMANSPTINVGYEVLSQLKKETHVAPMLSLDKTKDVSVLEDFINDKEGILSLKLDGLSIILTYSSGKLVKALTRGNGEVGEIITNNARTFVNLPNKINYDGELVIRGEALIKYSDFERINKEFSNIGEKYKNPRNLCSGSVRQLNNEITAKRCINFFAYNIIQADNIDDFSKKQDELQWLSSIGFDVVAYKMVTKQTMESKVSEFSNEVYKSDIPSDGLVLTFDDINYSKSLGTTAKYPKDSIAFKWKDEVMDTTLTDVEWSASRTGLINPVAIFEPVELEGTTVKRANLHNVSVLRDLKLGLGDTISVYKANMIIPQVLENKTQSNNLSIPEYCPVCNSKTELKNDNGSIVLICPNSNCFAKKLKAITHFASRSAMNIDGLSEATIEKMIEYSMIHNIIDIFYPEKYKETFVGIEGFGEKSYENLKNAIENSKNANAANFLYSLGIKGIGLSTAKQIVEHFPFKLSAYNKLTKDDFMEIDGLGEILVNALVEYFSNEININMILEFEKILNLSFPKKNNDAFLDGKTFVITGTLNHFENRNQCKEKIEYFGGKVSQSVSAKTDYLVNNDLTSNSSKNKKAKELNIPIISEDELLQMLNI